MDNKKQEPHPVHFGRWLLKNAKETFDMDQFLCWRYENKNYDTTELYEIFLKEFNRTNKNE